MPLTQVQGGMLAGSTNTTTTIQSNGTTAITIDSSQNVGIGTSNPAPVTGFTTSRRVLQVTNSGYGQLILGGSSGTMIALAGTKLHIGQNAHLGPFDPSIGILGIGAKDILSALPKEGTEGSFLTPVYRGMRTSATRAMKRIYSNLTDRIVQGKFSDEQVDRIKAQMIDGDISHDTPFFYSDLSYLGDYISCSIPENVYTIYDKFLEHGAPRKNSNPLLSALGM